MTTCYLDEKKIIFIHVHKCAGTAISKAFIDRPRIIQKWIRARDNEGVEAIMEKNNALIDSEFAAPEHFRAIDARELLGRDVYESYFSFAVSRNPWDRLASWYYFLRQSEKKGQSKIARQLTMEDFIHYSVDHFYLPQYQWVTDDAGDVIVDEIIKLENLDKRWPDIAAKVSDDPITLRTVNASSNTTEPKPNPFALVRTETLEKFRKAYAKDFELLGYSPDLPEHRADNPIYVKCDKVWTKELNGERDIKSLCKTYDVPEDFYMLYREANSANFYNHFSDSKLKSNALQKDRIVESLRNSHAENEKLSEKVKKWNAEAKNAQRTLSDQSIALSKNERNLKNKVKENEKLSADLKTQENYIEDLKSKYAESKTTVDELRQKSKTEFLDLQKKIRTLSEKNKALAQAYQKAQERNAS